jgi:hypothetical protein
MNTFLVSLNKKRVNSYSKHITICKDCSVITYFNLTFLRKNAYSYIMSMPYTKTTSSHKSLMFNGFSKMILNKVRSSVPGIFFTLVYTSVAFFAILVLPSGLYSQTPQGVSIETGYARVTGYYSSTFNAAPVFGMRVIPLEWKYFFADGSFSFSSFQLSKSNESHLYTTGGNVGINAYYRYKMISPFAGLSTGARYFYFNGKKTAIKLHTFKPSAGARIGLIAELSNRFSIAARTDYSRNTLSGKTFSELTHTVGITYRFGTSDSLPQTPDVIVSDHYSEGLKALAAGEFSSAREMFMKVSPKDPEYRDAQKYIDEINSSTAAVDEAKRLIADNKKLEAIPYLETASPRIIETAKIIESLRSELRKDIPSLEKNGVKAYDAKEYPLCIAIMRRLLIIDPNNKTAKLYLPRAEKRDEALRKLR